MHPAFQNLEVIHTVSSYTQHGSLPAFASTCRAFESPALNVLWRYLQSVEPLVKCLPSDLFGIDHGCVVLQKPLEGKMWDTLSKYTSRVHSITQSGHLKGIEHLSLLMLSCPLASASLFPNLHEITWRADGTQCAAEFLRMAFVPTLLVLDLQILSASSAFLSVLSSLGTLCPRLQDIVVKVPHPTDHLFRKSSPFITLPISQLHHLRTLRVWDLGNRGIEHVMQLRALQSLWLDLRASSTWDARPHLQFPGFDDLHLLGFFARTFECVSNFLSSLQVVRSKGISICLSHKASANGSTVMMLSQLFTILRERCENDKLESFVLFVNSTKVFKQVRTEPGIFTPLHAYSNLTRLDIEKCCDMSMSDEELCQLVGTWPKLRVLKISCHVAINDTTVPTFHGLISLLRLCPALTSLALVIDTTKLEGIDLKCPGGERCNEQLKSLALGNSSIESPVNVALILSGLFPCLTQVNLDCWDTAPMNSLPQKKSDMERWELTNSILGGFSLVRQRGIKACRCSDL
ncbi:uncharacterized protein EDB91DRAFT_495084 [Suillus paluster]|uniref:uncharacterized protein n=1 Tax=Suillus paluster TaxID=48578 RepID=UPI001B876F07|nr:uncharacterized protein EDB91DRAFT_495084 [Suillus paluster]KAG1736877.1 hypothetical protein EDB91DRAFT_495084 [Suillus paluster]